MLLYKSVLSLVKCSQETDEVCGAEHVCICASAGFNRSVGNVSYNSPNAATALLHARCDTLLCELIRSSDATKHSYVAQAVSHVIHYTAYMHNDCEIVRIRLTSAIQLLVDHLIAGICGSS
jgi:DNA-binding LacI/PurR family transcriptional regulator